LVNQEEEELPPVPLADAIPEPGAMMIECGNAPFADLTVLCAHWLILFALLAMTLLHIQHDLFLTILVQ